MTQVVTAAGPNFVDALFAEVKLSAVVLPAPGVVAISGRLYKPPTNQAFTAAKETWDKFHDLFKKAARDGWDAVKLQFDAVMAFMDEQVRDLGGLAEEYQQLLLEKVHEMMRKSYEFLLKSLSQQVQIGEQFYILNSIDLETKLVFSASVEASVATLGKFLGSGEATIKGTYSIPGAAVK